MSLINFCMVMLSVNNNKLINIINKEIKRSKPKETLPAAKQDSIKISVVSRAFNKLSVFLNLGKSDRLDFNNLSSQEKKEFFKMLSKLLKKGIIGYEILEINGKREKHYIVNEIGDERIYGAELYKRTRYERKTIKE